MKKILVLIALLTAFVSANDSAKVENITPLPIDSIPDSIYTNINFFELDKEVTSKYLKLSADKKKISNVLLLVSITSASLAYGILSTDDGHPHHAKDWGLAFAGVSVTSVIDGLFYAMGSDDDFLIAVGQKKPYKVIQYKKEN